MPATTNLDSFSKRLTEHLKRTRPEGGKSASRLVPDMPASTPPADQPVAPQSDLPSVAGETSKAAGAACSCSPAGEGEQAVKQGDCITSIANASGHLWQTIWDDPANAALRAARSDPNVLLPHDRVHVPGLREKWEPGQSEMRHRFRRRGQTAVLPLRLMIGDEPIANQPYTLEIDGARPIEGYTDAEGKLRCHIPASAKRGRIVVGPDRREFTLDLGHMDPVESLAGVQKRLLNLGFDCRRTDGQWDSHCEAALRRFQRRSGLPDSGQPDDATRRKLSETHGS